ncbi:MAG TPA: hypothetical protein VFQ47_04670 [Nitrososphaera sp.]|jgi:hypothetical protein|nr:hypothetical protein [Nitrososphaera sp.]
MKKIFLAKLIILSLVSGTSAQNQGDLCHVYVVDVEKARKAFDNFRETGNAQADAKALSVGQVVFPEFRTVIGEEELTTKSYPFPGSNLVITASVFYTDESMASSEGADSMLLGVIVSPKAQKDALSSENNSVAEITLNDRDTVRAKKYVKVNSRLYLVGIECHCKERKESK